MVQDDQKYTDAFRFKCTRSGCVQHSVIKIPADLYALDPKLSEREREGDGDCEGVQQTDPVRAEKTIRNAETGSVVWRSQES